MDAEQSLLKLDAYCHFRQMATIYENDNYSHFIGNVMELTSEALASFKLAFDRVDVSPLRICSNILSNILNYIKNSSFYKDFHDLFVVVEDAYKNVNSFLDYQESELKEILTQKTPIL